MGVKYDAHGSCKGKGVQKRGASSKLMDKRKREIVKGYNKSVAGGFSGKAAVLGMGRGLQTIQSWIQALRIRQVKQLGIHP